MQDITTKTIREIALELPLTTRVFEEFKIDYCCGGRVPFAEACKTAGVDPLTVMLKIDAVTNLNGTDGDFAADRMAMSELAEYIVTTHHVFTRDEISRLLPLADKVCGKHGDHSPELFEIKQNFSELAAELLEHMRKEELVLFPYINELEKAAELNEPVNIPHFGTVRNPVRMMMFEHDSAGDILRRIRSLSLNFSPPEGACPSFVGLYAGLEAFEKDLHRHIHLENNILFPQAIETEERVAKQQGPSSIGQCLAHSVN